MSNFIPRNTQPTNSDLRWIAIVGGGYNACIEGYPQPTAYSVLANCTGYVHGRWLELLNATVDNMNTTGLPLGNATTYWTDSSSRIQRSNRVKLGAIACWDGTINGGLGHVAVIEEIKTINGELVVSYSESNYGGAYFTYVQNKPLNTLVNEQGFQGFLIHPDITPEPTSSGFKWWMSKLILERRRKEK